ncbi:MAG: outer membrane beta-barrel protein [Pseudomonadota bacterium]
MKTLYLAGVSAAMLAFAGTAVQAADLPDVQEPVFAPIAPVFDFSGFYLGANVGYINADLDADLFNPATGQNLISFGGDSNGGIIGGVQAGVNAQFDQFVLGVEGDISGVSFELGDDNTLIDTAPGILAAAGGVAGTGIVGDLDVDVDYLATLRARAGIAVDRFMIYGTGGFAFTSVDVDYSVPGAVFDVDSDDDVQVGYAIGAGVEGFVTQNLTAKLEYLYTDFEEQTIDFTIPATGVSRAIEADLDAHVVRAGINYKFGGF